jgi:hypothetical protein
VRRVTGAWQGSSDGGTTWFPLGVGTEVLSGGTLTSSATVQEYGGPLEVRDVFVNDPTGVRSGIQLAASLPATLTLLGPAVPVITAQPADGQFAYGSTTVTAAARRAETATWSESLDRGVTWTSVDPSAATAPDWRRAPPRWSSRPPSSSRPTPDRSGP